MVAFLSRESTAKRKRRHFPRHDFDTSTTSIGAPQNRNSMLDTFRWIYLYRGRSRARCLGVHGSIIGGTKKVFVGCAVATKKLGRQTTHACREPRYVSAKEALVTPISAESLPKGRLLIQYPVLKASQTLALSFVLPVISVRLQVQGQLRDHVSAATHTSPYQLTSRSRYSIPDCTVRG